jgi:APA family basic amino acid/polyamine antiporter
VDSVQSQAKSVAVREADALNNSSGLVPTLGLFSSTALVIGSMIGSGIFIVDADIARGTNSPALYLGAWVVTAILTMIGALSYGELAAMMPKAGGQYIYLRESLGPLWGFLYGWTLFVVIQTGTIAAVCVAFGKFLGVFFPAVSTTHWLWHIATGAADSVRADGAGEHGYRSEHR